MDISIITSKGTVTIPSQIRRALNLEPGQKVSFERNKDGEVVLKRALTIEEVHAISKPYLGRFESKLQGKSLDEFINEGIAGEVVKKYIRPDR